ncbi:hypothetical protein DK1_000014 [Bacillus phage DK1]|uniref:Uncharacterized protein n=1 Tax=Bacillus phage DK1 TaxID=2500808 RepID=A0A3T0IIS4_9CAUD|nr:hypothetical protein H3016_gp14 [Bacillus phage DK1]AZU99718.1 hypothetical protein DK1_000014 [Bacillus phage DK1]
MERGGEMKKYIYTDKGTYIGWTSDLGEIYYLEGLPDIILEDQLRKEIER